MIETLDAIFHNSVAGFACVVWWVHQSLAAIQRRLGGFLEAGVAPLDHRYARLFAIQSQLEQMGPSYDVVVGDSIVESAILRPICDRPILNAGIGGATTAMVRRDILPLLERVPPRVLVIAIGVNDCVKSGLRLRSRRVVAFLSEYRALIASAKSIAKTVVAVTIAPVEAGKPLGDEYHDVELLTDFKQAIRTVAADYAIPVIELDALADKGGLALAGTTSDGVHLTRLGYEIWCAAIEAGLKRARAVSSQ